MFRNLLLVASLLVLCASCRWIDDADVEPQIELDPMLRELQLGDTTTLRLVRGEMKVTLSDSVPTEWFSSNSEVLEVTRDGYARARKLGIVDVRAVAGDSAGTWSVRVGPPVLVGAGDIAKCGQIGSAATARMLDFIKGTVFTAGDNVYEHGTPAEYLNCYDPTWGRHKDRTRPSPGNHDFYYNNGSSYYDYFGDAAGPRGLGYYSYDLPNWHVIVLNTSISYAKDSPQELWLRADLAANPSLCTLAYGHFPRFSSAREQHSDTTLTAIWQDLYEHGVELVISGHSHTYERFAPQTPDGQLDRERGIRQIVVGTGGMSLLPFDAIEPNSEVHDNSTFGLLKLSLYPDRYSWEFLPVVKNGFTDFGSTACH